MDPELLRLLLALLRDQNTTGSAETGGTWPYDDYGLQNTIGGIGAVMGESDGDFADGSIEAMNANPTRHDTSPSTYGGAVPYVPPAPVSPSRPVGMMSPEIGAILQQMQTGLGQRSDTPTGPPLTIQRSQDMSPRPVAAPTAEPLRIKGNGAGPQPAPTAEPVARFNDALPKAKQRQTKAVAQRQNAQQAAQRIVTQAVAAQPQRQYSAPAPVYTPTFTPAPASRAAAQNTLAQALNTMRSLNRR
jgi:hypothetical protein